MSRTELRKVHPLPLPEEYLTTPDEDAQPQVTAEDATDEDVVVIPEASEVVRDLGAQEVVGEWAVPEAVTPPTVTPPPPAPAGSVPPPPAWPAPATTPRVPDTPESLVAPAGPAATAPAMPATTPAAPIATPAVSAPVPTSRRWLWIGLAALGAVVVGVVAFLLLAGRGGDTATVTRTIDGLGTLEFQSWETVDRWEVRPGMVARPAASDATLLVIRSQFVGDVDNDDIMDWARDVEVSHPDAGVLAPKDAMFIGVRTRVDGEAIAPQVDWVFNVPADVVAELEIDLGSGADVLVGDLPRVE